MTGVAGAAFDFTECEKEPLCFPGQIQPHGQLLAIGPNSEITHVSENFRQIFPIDPADALRLTLSEVMGAQSTRILRHVIPGLKPGDLYSETCSTCHGSALLSIHRRGDRCILEWEPPARAETQSPFLFDNTLSEGLAEIGSTHLIHRQTQRAAELTSRLTGFDRVMIYRFHPDWSGEVVSEIRKPRAEPFLGLRYPASDIPSQARQLYRENLLRVLVDVGGAPAGILARPGDSAPLDLTMAELRAISPYHLEYLRNMKVGATATASILIDGELWGMLACHHDRRRIVSAAEKTAMREIARTLGDSVRTATGRARRLAQQRIDARQALVVAGITDVSRALVQILFGQERLRNMARGCGAAIFTREGTVRQGIAPSTGELEGYASRILSGAGPLNGTEGGDADMVAIESRAGLREALGAAPRSPAIAGMLAIVVSREPALILFVFRTEELGEIIWGGDINQPVLRDERTGKLAPRRSFAQYKQNVQGKAVPWSEEDRANAGILLRVLRAKAPDAASTSRLIGDGLRQIGDLITEEHPLHNSVFDAIGSGISIVFRSESEDPAVRYANRTLLDLAEISTENQGLLPSLASLLDAIGLPSEILAESDVAPRQVMIPSAIEGVRYFLVEKVLALEIADAKGTRCLSSLVFTDTTRSERARDALQAAQRKAEHLAFLKSSFLANMSHEIRTPMNGILGMVQLLETTRLDAEQKKYLDVVARSGDAMLSIVNDILDLSKIEAGRVELENAPFDLTALVQGILDLLRPRAAEKALGLSALWDSPPPRWYRGDASRLRQILLNIVGNAVKFTAAGEVVICVTRQDGAQPPTPLRIEVSDTGIGMSEEQLVGIFDKFTQADPSTTRKFGGTGLGLAIARELAELMGGSIGVTSVCGAGSAFTISLPLESCADPASPGSMAGAPEPPRGPGAGRRILVAEDNRVNQMVIEAMLLKQGFDVEIVDTGTKLLDLLRLRGCDLILMDCQMPDMNGYDATARIRERESGGRRTPIVALTAHAMPEDRQRCLEAGMDDHLAKPVAMKDLWAVLRKWNCLPAE